MARVDLILVCFAHRDQGFRRFILELTEAPRILTGVMLHRRIDGHDEGKLAHCV